jgi:hypothetical protein
MAISECRGRRVCCNAEGMSISWRGWLPTKMMVIDVIRSFFDGLTGSYMATDVWRVGGPGECLCRVGRIRVVSDLSERPKGFGRSSSMRDSDPLEGWVWRRVSSSRRCRRTRSRVVRWRGECCERFRVTETGLDSVLLQCDRRWSSRVDVPSVGVRDEGHGRV